MNTLNPFFEATAFLDEWSWILTAGSRAFFNPDPEVNPVRDRD
jgi:hypothetical protein